MSIWRGDREAIWISVSIAPPDDRSQAPARRVARIPDVCSEPRFSCLLSVRDVDTDRQRGKGSAMSDQRGLSVPPSLGLAT